MPSGAPFFCGLLLAKVAGMTAAILVLADGSVFRGRAAGAAGLRVGEVVFNTAMTGYQEILTDPSYARQLVTLTCPHIGNTGTTPQDDESRAVFCGGLIVKDVPAIHSNWRAESALAAFLTARDVVAICGIDTRKLTRLIRRGGAQNGCIIAGDDALQNEAKALAAAREFAGLAGMDLAREVSCDSAYEWHDGSWRHDEDDDASKNSGDE